MPINTTLIPKGEMIQLPPLTAVQLSLLSIGFTAVHQSAIKGPGEADELITLALVDMLVRGGDATAIIAELRALSDIIKKLADNFSAREIPNANSPG